MRGQPRRAEHDEVVNEAELCIRVEAEQAKWKFKYKLNEMKSSNLIMISNDYYIEQRSEFFSFNVSNLFTEWLSLKKSNETFFIGKWNCPNQHCFFPFSSEL